MTKAHHPPTGGFRNPWGDDATQGLRSIFKWKVIDRFTRPPARAPDPAPFPVAVPSFPVPHAPLDRLVLTWVGHATFLLQVGGLNLLTDPIWSDRASPVQFAGPRRRVAPAVPFAGLPPIDAVLLSHNHYDHLDDRTVRRLAAAHPQARWLVPLGLAPFVRQRGARDALELDWWEETRVGELAIGCTPARHFSSRGLGDRNRTLWCGWSVAAPARQVYFAGDTAYHPEFAAIADRFGPFHAALLPIGAYEPRWFMRSVHMNPEEAVRVYQDLERGRPPIAGRVALMVAMHWGTFQLTDEPLDEPPKRARAAWRGAGFDPNRLWIPTHGESRTI